MAQGVAEFRTLWADTIGERGDSSELAQLLVIAERDAWRAQSDIVALDRAMTQGGPLSADSRFSCVQDHIDALLRDNERLRSLEPTGSRSQIETATLIRPLLHHLAQQLHSFLRTFLSLSVKGARPAQPGSEYLHESAELAGITTCLIRCLVNSGRKSSRYSGWQHQLAEGADETIIIPKRT